MHRTPSLASFFLAALALTALLAGTALAQGLKAGDIDPANGKRIKYWAAPMDPTYIRQEPGKSPMGMDLVPVYEEEGGEKEPTSTIRIDPVTVQNMGVRIAPVKRQALSREIRALGTVAYDERRVVAVSTKFNGWIENLRADFVGQPVRRGQPLFDIYSPELVTAQEEYRLALEQQKALGDSPYPSVSQGAQRLLAASRKRLRYWDIPESAIQRLEADGPVAKTVTVYAPASGIVTRKAAVEGHYVKAGEHQYEIADLSSVWVDAEVYENELPFVRQGMPARMELAYLPGRAFAGRVLFIYPYVTAKTRTVKLRLEFANPGGELKPDMYADVHLHSAVSRDTLVVPQEAVIDSGARKVVFVAKGQGRFEPREVKLGTEGGDGAYQVLSGLKEGENVVVSAQFMLDSESRLREAIRKMTEAQAPAPAPDPDLDMTDLKMDK